MAWSWEVEKGRKDGKGLRRSEKGLTGVGLGLKGMVRGLDSFPVVSVGAPLVLV